jgi:acetylornithine deacetylase/succinyl-diaminopimelate desuccinylase-like protein
MIMKSRADSLGPGRESGGSVHAAADEVVELCADLVRFDTTNYGGGKANGERPAADYVVRKLDEVGISSTLLESAPGRANVVARIAGTEPDRSALLVHGHLDVVPAVAADWSVPPFAGEQRDGFLYGRGTIDMKSACATTLAVARAFARSGRRPRRDVVLAFLADEEDTGDFGSRWLVQQHPELFAGVSEAVSESGGFTVHAGPDLRLYPIAVGERGSAWMRLTATGTAGHAAKVNHDNAVATLIAALARLSAYEWPVRLVPAVQRFLETVGAALGVEVDLSDVDGTVARLGPAASLVSATIRCSTTPTMLEAGYKVNVVPGSATAYVDGRVLPGCDEEFLGTVDSLLGPGITREFVNREEALIAPHAGPLVEAISAALLAEEPDARVVPFVMSGGTDGKAFARLGISGYGFAPLRLPAELTYGTMAHCVDERVPVDGLRFGARVFERFLTNC